MNHFLDCNMQKKFYALSLITILVVSSFGSVLHSSAQSSRADELIDSITKKNEEIQNLELEIKKYQEQLSSVGSEKRTLQNTIKQLDISRAKLAKDIQLTERKIERTNYEINDLSLQIKRKELQIEKDRELIARTIRQIDEAEGNTLLESFLSHNSISEFLQEIDDLNKFQGAISDNINALLTLKDDLAKQKNKFESEHKNLKKLNTQISDQKYLADVERKNQGQVLNETKNKESNYKKLLDERIARKKQFEREVEDFEAQLRSEIDPNSFPRPGSRVLAYPLENTVITQHFGKTVDARRLYSSGTHNGIDFRASMGTPITSAGDGVVEGIGDTDATCRYASYGKWVLVRHKNGLSTLYAHLSLIKVNRGESVSTGDLLGYSGNTGYSTGPHLHFTVLVSSAVQVDDLPSKSCPGAVFRLPVAPQNAYLDPEAYL